MSFFQCLQSALNILGAQENPDLVEEILITGSPHFTWNIYLVGIQCLELTFV